jgi:hypothetical protein
VDFEFTPERTALRKAVREFAEADIARQLLQTR